MPSSALIIGIATIITITATRSIADILFHDSVPNVVGLDWLIISLPQLNYNIAIIVVVFNNTGLLFFIFLLINTYRVGEIIKSWWHYVCRRPIIWHKTGTRRKCWLI